MTIHDKKKRQLINSNSFYLTFRTLQEDIKQNFRILPFSTFLKIWKLFVWKCKSETHAYGSDIAGQCQNPALISRDHVTKIEKKIQPKKSDFILNHSLRGSCQQSVALFVLGLWWGGRNIVMLGWCVWLAEATPLTRDRKQGGREGLGARYTLQQLVPSSLPLPGRPDLSQPPPSVSLTPPMKDGTPSPRETYYVQVIGGETLGSIPLWQGWCGDLSSCHPDGQRGQWRLVLQGFLLLAL